MRSGNSGLVAIKGEPIDAEDSRSNLAARFADGREPLSTGLLPSDMAVNPEHAHLLDRLARSPGLVIDVVNDVPSAR